MLKEAKTFDLEFSKESGRPAQECAVGRSCARERAIVAVCAVSAAVAVGGVRQALGPAGWP